MTAVVKRYFALAIAGDSRKACAALAPGLAKTVPLQYGRYGPPYLHGAKTCAEILGRVFARRHRELTAPVTVTDVFVGNDEAFVLIGSPRMPASFIDPVRRRGRWFVDEMLGTPFS